MEAKECLIEDDEQMEEDDISKTGPEHIVLGGAILRVGKLKTHYTILGLAKIRVSCF